MVLFVISNFEITQPSKLLIPSSLMIMGIGLLMTYIDGNQLTYILLLSFLFIAAGIIVIIIHGEINFHSFCLSIVGVVEKYWSVLIIFTGIFLIFRKENT